MQIPKTLPASLKNDTVRMNERNKHKVTGQVNQQTADSKANASQNKKSCNPTHKPTQIAAHFILPKRTQAHPSPDNWTVGLLDKNGLYKGIKF
jgi:hypothetical protein